MAVSVSAGLARPTPTLTLTPEQHTGEAPDPCSRPGNPRPQLMLQKTVQASTNNMPLTGCHRVYKATKRNQNPASPQWHTIPTVKNTATENVKRLGGDT